MTSNYLILSLVYELRYPVLRGKRGSGYDNIRAYALFLLSAILEVFLSEFIL